MSRRLILAALCVGMDRANAQPAPAWNLQTLMTALRQVRSSTASYVEMRYTNLLDQAQKSSGRLIYVAPDHLEKITTDPGPARLTIIGDRLTIEQPGVPMRSLSLRDNAEVGAMVESFRATLAGDLPTLNRLFTTSLDGDANNWTLGLVPIDARLRDVVASIRIKGTHATIRQIETREADGDRTDMAITPDPE